DASTARLVGPQFDAALAWQANRNLGFAAAYSVIVPGGFVADTGPAWTVHFVGDRRCSGTSRGRLEHADLPQEADLVVEQLLLDDLAVPPPRHRAELEREALVRRRMHLAVETLPGTDHLPRPVRDGAGPVAGRDHDLVWIVGEMVLDRLEECLRLGLVCVATVRRVRLPRPVH